MKTLIQKVHVEENHSFACRTYRTPTFETNWHKHEEYELIVITEGTGTAMIGDYVGEYKVNDVFFIAGNMPHWFRKASGKIVGSAIVAQFKKEIFGDSFLSNPELKSIAALLQKDEGVQCHGKLKVLLKHHLKQLEVAKQFSRIYILLDALQQIAASKEVSILSHQFNSNDKHINPAIEKIIDYSFKHYLKHITLKEVATLADMSIPTFCRFFKRNIKKSYFDFLQELRINHACKLLNSTNKAVLEICYESGYNSWAHFSKQFKQVKKTTPSKYRKEFALV